MSQFTVRGRFQTRDGWNSYTKTVEAPNEDVATDRVYAEFGSEHNLKRTQVEISEVSAR